MREEDPDPRSRQAPKELSPPWKRAQVLFFDENRGRGLLRVIDTGERIPFTYRDVVGEEGFITFFEGEPIWVRKAKNRVQISRVR